MSFSDTQSAKRYASIAEVAAAQAKIYAQELEEAPNYAAEAAASAEAAATSSTSASQYASNAATAASSASSSASAAASSAADAAGAAQSAIGQTVRAPQGETLSPMPEASARKNKYIATDSAGGIALVDRATIPVLDSSGKLPVSTIPAIALTEPFVVSSQAAMLALDAQTGDIAKRTDLGYSFCLAASPASTLSNWIQLTDDVLAQLGLSSGATQVGATSLTGASSTVQAELSKKPDSANLAASNGAASIGALDDTGSATTVQGALALKVAATTLAGTGAGKGANIVGYKSALAGAAARTIQSKFAEFLSVKDFGAVGDGSTDDTAAIQAAVNACVDINAVLYFPAGYYVVSSVINVNLSIKTHLTLRGSGTSSTVIKCTGQQAFLSATSSTSNNIWLDSVTPNGSLDIFDMSICCWGGNDNGLGNAIYINTNTIVGTPAHSIQISRVHFRSEVGSFNYDIYLENTAQVKIDSCNFYAANGSQKGIAIKYGNSAGKDGAGLQVSNCEFFYFQYGVYITDHYEGGQFVNCNFINCYGGIFAVIAGAESGIFINGCEFDCYFKGVYLQNMFDFVIADSCFFSIDADSYIGIHIRGGSRFTVTGNKIQGESSSVVGGIGILLENTDDSLGGAAYVGGNAIGSMNIGMQISDCSNVTFGPWAWRNCNVDTFTSGTNTYIQQGNYELVSSIVKTLSSATTAWSFTVDISKMRIQKVPDYANLVSQSVDNFVCRYVKSSSSNTSLTFEVTYGNNSSIAANTYGFSLLVKSPYFINVN
nr:MAG TPA: tail spike protein [Caudoviricetes sp.]